MTNTLIFLLTNAHFEDEHLLHVPVDEVDDVVNDDDFGEVGSIVSTSQQRITLAILRDFPNLVRRPERQKRVCICQQENVIFVNS